MFLPWQERISLLMSIMVAVVDGHRFFFVSENGRPPGEIPAVTTTGVPGLADDAGVEAMPGVEVIRA